METVDWVQLSIESAQEQETLGLSGFEGLKEI